jgi:hypothetical protein
MSFSKAQVPLLAMTLLATGCGREHDRSDKDHGNEGAGSPAMSATATDGTELLCPLEGDDGLSFTYAGSKWNNVNISASFMPDGTSVTGGGSGLSALLNPLAPEAVWKREYARALARWAAVSPLNFRIVPDAGIAGGSSGLGQVDPRVGDIRIGARTMVDVAGYTYYPTVTGTNGGDIYFNKTPLYAYQIGAHVDVYSVALHESGHALGLGHSSWGTIMFNGLFGVTPALTADDIAGIQSVYGVREPDDYDAAGDNGYPAFASNVAISAAQATFVNGDLTTVDDVDHYKVKIPSGFGSVLSVTAVGSQSLLQSTLRLYDAAGNLLKEVSAPSYGAAALLQWSGVTAGSTYIIGVDSPVSDEFGSGSYRLAIESRSSADGVPYSPPAPLVADSKENNDSFAKATALGSVSNTTVKSLNINWTWDDDFFSFKTALLSRTYQVALAYTSGTDPLEIEIYNASGAKIASSNGAASVNFAVSGSTTYTAKVYSPRRTVRGYNLTVKKVN